MHLSPLTTVIHKAFLLMVVKVQGCLLTTCIPNDKSLEMSMSKWIDFADHKVHATYMIRVTFDETMWKKLKMLVLKALILQGCQNLGLYGKG